MAEPRNPELETAIERDPDDREAYRVYADWLEGHGNPRAALIRAQLADRDPDEPGKPSRKLLIEHREALLGPLFVYAKSLTWRYGFLRTAKLKDTGSSCVPHLQYLLATASGRFLRELDVTTGDLGPAADALATLPPTLRALTLDHRGAAIDLVVPANLTELSLTGRFELGELPALSSARLRGPLSAASADALAVAPLAQLHRLELGLFDIGVTADDLAPLFERRDLAVLAVLELAHAGFADGLAALLAISPFARQLTTLTLPGITQAGARSLARTSFGRLSFLDVTGAELDADGWALLEGMKIEQLVCHDRWKGERDDDDDDWP